MNNTREVVKLEPKKLDKPVNLYADRIRVLKYILLGVLMVGLIIGTVFATLKLTENREGELREEAYNMALDSLKVEFDNEVIELEVGKELEYDKNLPAELSSLPLEIAKHIKTYPQNAYLSVDNISSTTVGEKTYSLRLEIQEPNYQQTVVNRQDFNVNFVDNIEPTVLLEASSINVQNEEQILNNVKLVVDSLCGEYPYSQENTNRTYSLDLSNINWEEDGDYQVNIIINDNGVIREQYFNAKVNIRQLEKEAEEKAKKEAEEKEKKKDKEG